MLDAVSLRPGHRLVQTLSQCAVFLLKLLNLLLETGIVEPGLGYFVVEKFGLGLELLELRLDLACFRLNFGQLGSLTFEVLDPRHTPQFTLLQLLNFSFQISHAFSLNCLQLLQLKVRLLQRTPVRLHLLSLISDDALQRSYLNHVLLIRAFKLTRVGHGILHKHLLLQRRLF